MKRHSCTRPLAGLVMLTLLGCGGARPASVPSAGSSASEAPAQAFFIGAPEVAPERRLRIHPSGGPGEVHASTGGARLVLSSVPQEGASSANVVAVAEQRAWAHIAGSWQCGDRHAFLMDDGSLALSDTYLGDLTAVTPESRFVRLVAVADGRLLFLDNREARGTLVDCHTGALRDLSIPNDPPIIWMQWTPRAGAVVLTNDGAVYRAERLSGPFERTPIRHFTETFPLAVRDGAIAIPDGTTTHQIPASPLVDETVPRAERTEVELAQFPPEVAPWFMDARERDDLFHPERPESEASFPLRDGRWFRDGRIYDAEGRFAVLDVCNALRRLPFNGGMLYFCRDGSAQFVTDDGRLLPTTLPLDARPGSWIADPLGTSLLCHACGPDASTVALVGDDQRQEVLMLPSEYASRAIGIRGDRILVPGQDWAGYWIALDGTLEVLRVPSTMGIMLSESSLSDDGVLSVVTVDRRTGSAGRFWASFDFGPLRELAVPPTAQTVAFARADLAFAVAGSAAEERRAWVSRDRGETWLELALGVVGPSSREAPRRQHLVCSRMGCRWHDVWLGVPPPGTSVPMARRAAPLPAHAAPDEDFGWYCHTTWDPEPTYPRVNEDDEWRRRIVGPYVRAGLAVEVRGRLVRLHVADADERGPFEWASAWGFDSSPDDVERFSLLAATRDAAFVSWCRLEDEGFCTHWFIRRRRDARRVEPLDNVDHESTFRIHRGALHWIQYSDSRGPNQHVSWTPEGGAVVVEEAYSLNRFSEVRGEPRMMRTPSDFQTETWLPDGEGGSVRMPVSIALCETPAGDERLVDSYLGLARVQVAPDGVCLNALRIEEGGVWVQPNGENSLFAEEQRFGGTVSVDCSRGQEQDDEEDEGY